ncbi:alpha/beta hydrolase [Rosistilla oblonga]|uniref:alpha/beta hydrolase n=1 Tax=Rosistilla oblonga TaxID=2527990 RepID=UPI003A983710
MTASPFGLLIGLLLSLILVPAQLLAQQSAPPSQVQAAPPAAPSAIATPSETPAADGAAPSEAAIGDSLLAEPTESVAEDVVGKEAVAAELETAPLAEFDVRSLDQVWTISSRCVGSHHAPVQSLQFRRRIEGNRWQTESAESFFADNAGPLPMRTILFVHGNRTPEVKALRRGLQTYDQTVLNWQRPDSAVRFVIWMWPADKISGQLRDVRVKAARADLHAFHLARVITEIQPQQQVSVIGYSFGGRLAVGAMHLLGGGSLCGSRLPVIDPELPWINLALLAPAIRNDCFVTSRNAALRPVDHLFVLHNSRDQYLKLYRFLKLDNHTPALGYTGLCGLGRHQLASDRVHQYDAARSVGSDHNYLEYVADRRIESLVRQNIFFDTGAVPPHAVGPPHVGGQPEIRSFRLSN